MIHLTGNRRLIFETLQEIPGPVSFGMLAYMCGCHRRTVIRAVQEMAAAGLLRRVRMGERQPNRYELLIW